MTTSIFRCGGAAAAVALALIAAPPAAAEHDVAGRRAADAASYVVYADVVQVSPRYGWRTVTEPVRQCVDVTARASRRYAYAGYRERYRGRYDRHERWRQQHDGAEVAAGLVGGLIGGLIGNQFGGGSGKTALTVAGAALGASIAGDHVRRSRVYDGYPSHAGTVRRCTETRQTRQVRGLDGYDVTYRYQGRTFHKWMDQHPGDTVAVHVSVEPADDDATWR